MLQLWRKTLWMMLLLAFMVAPAQAQVAVFSVKSIDDLRGDFHYLAKMAGMEDQAKEIDAIIDSLADGKGLFGIDMKKPLGVYLYAPKNLQQGDEPEFVVFAPITKEKEFLGFLEAVNIQVGEPKNGIRSFSAGGFGPRGYFKFANNYVFASNKEEHLKKNLPAPEKTLSAFHKSHVLAFSFRITEIPKQFKQEMFDELDRELKREKRRNASESDIEYRAKVFVLDTIRNIISSLVNEGKEAGIGLQIDKKNHKINIDGSLTAKPGTGLANAISTFGNTPSMFSVLVKQSAMSAFARLPIAKELQEERDKLLAQLKKQALNEIKDNEARELFQTVFNAIEPTLKMNVLDGGVTLRGPLGDNRYVILAAMKVQKGKLIEQLIKDLHKTLPPRVKAAFTFDKERVLGSSVHLFEPPARAVPEQFTRHFGKLQIYFVIQEDKILIAIGQHGLKAMKETIDDLSKNTQVKGVTPVQLEVAISKILPLSPENRAMLMQAAKEVFVGKDKDKDRVRVQLRGGKQLQLRFQADAQLLKLIGKVIAARRGNF